jgi:two-component system, NarL family, sensor histidine kinase DesK
VRHSGAQRCDIEISTTDGAAALSVVDNGGAAGGAAFGNGLLGLTERLAAAGGTLEAGARDGGFALVARLPL